MIPMQRKTAKTGGIITGWLSNRKKGAPKKSKPAPKKKSAKKNKNAARAATVITSTTASIAGVAFGATSRPKASDKAVAVSTSTPSQRQV